MTKPGQADYSLAQAMAERALRRQALIPAAARAMALIAVLRDRNPAVAERFMNLSERMSRRDYATQLLFIQTNVERGDVGSALVHYDRALRTSEEARTTLLPILVAAVGDEGIAHELAPFLAQQPMWKGDFLTALVLNGQNARSIATLLAASRLQLDHLADRALFVQGMQRIVQLGDPRLAYATYRRVGGKGKTTLLADGDFSTDPVLPPFDWSFNDAGGISAVREQGDGGKWALRIDLPSGSRGWVARQLVMMEPGRYRLSRTISVDGSGGSDGQLSMTVNCINGTVLMHEDKMMSSRTAFDMTVPDGCIAAWVVIEGVGPLDGAVTTFRLSDVKLTPK
ncbi:hypothetical protein [Sphingomonas sp. SORGH_AS_0950]|uniref:hypothetical protein n=1 Tax=Sphingomonas sp. SORGH_AS_0950 TaxID=3041792 RepID=UPI0027D907CB|nr:hypothetical protein [Sphingomonas sp. SORGH_AS_0950]